MQTAASYMHMFAAAVEDDTPDEAKFHCVEKYVDWCSIRDRQQLGFGRCHALKLTSSFSDLLPSDVRLATPSRTFRNVP